MITKFIDEHKRTCGKLLAMSLLNRFQPTLPLRLGFGLMYLYSGYDMVVNPAAWVWTVQPPGLKDFIEGVTGNIHHFLQLQGVVEIIMALIFLAWFAPTRFVRWAALLSTVLIALILWFTGLDGVTFRNLGLVGASLALFFFYLRSDD